MSKLAAVTAEVMNIAAMVRRGDDAAWAGIGPDAHEGIVSELRVFADLARDMQDVEGPMSLEDASVHAVQLADEVSRTKLPVTVRAQDLASKLLGSLGVDEQLLNALDGEP